MLNQKKKKRFESFKTSTIRTEEMLYVKGGICCGSGDPPPGDPPPALAYPGDGEQEPKSGDDNNCAWKG
ncbi:hypothetical protein [uncultured Microscilla sp.]|uniref:hypothetical protein n=1 Tax=uncultured Microscilla sp. TaxID=432653 RepID=UPI002612BCDD|nr:hypothetical protein [uncultured Microscilla sp.]